MTNSQLKLTLYYADWCGHCQDFKQEWKQLKNNVHKKYNDTVVTIAEYEEKELAPIGGGRINDTEIRGYPTLKFGLSKGKESKEYEYTKERDSTKLLEYIKRICAALSKYKN